MICHNKHRVLQIQGVRLTLCQFFKKLRTRTPTTEFQNYRGFFYEKTFFTLRPSGQLSEEVIPLSWRDLKTLVNKKLVNTGLGSKVDALR
jgi:hypothetical protein